MVLEGIVIIVCFFLFLFTLYVLSREDFVFLRKNVTVNQIFDVAFITLICSLLFARLFYVAFHYDPMYLNPLVFFLVPYFPGLSILGGILGALFTLFIITKRKKYPRGRFLDFFCFAFLAVLPVGYIGLLIRNLDSSPLFAVLPIVYYGFLFFFFLRVLMPRFLQGQMKDGMIGQLILTNYALFSSVMLILTAVNEKTPIITPQLIIFFCIFLFSLLFYLKQGLSFPRFRS